MTIPDELKQMLPETLLSGSAESFGMRIIALTLQDGSRIALPKSGVLAVVGPNNAGKSTLLREIVEHVRLGPGQPGIFRIVDKLQLSVSGNEADVVSWLSAHAQFGRTERQAQSVFLPFGAGGGMDSTYLSGGPLATYWAHAEAVGGVGTALADFVVHYATTENRLEMSKPAPIRENASDAPRHPVHVLAGDPVRRSEANRISTDVFGDALYIDEISASNRLRVGNMHTQMTSENLANGSWRQELLGLPDLAQQGDGMRSFFGLLLPLLSSSFPIVVVDEPEAFLHPPQAAALGRELGALTKKIGLQLILATHDRHLLAGLTESDVDLSIVRVDHKQSGNIAHQIAPEELKTLGAEPALKYTNALDGPFHRLVVLVEGERDARFYAAATDAAHQQSKLAINPGDILFVPCGGKGGMPKLAAILRSLGVPVVASPDFDILRTEGEVRALIVALGGDWKQYVTDYAASLVGVEKSTSALMVRDLISVLSDQAEEKLSENHRKTVERFIKSTDGGWGQVKVAGLAALGSGGTGATAAKLVERLDQLGLVLVRVGELESFGPALGVAKGGAWVPAAFEQDLHRSPEAMAHARRLVRSASKVNTESSDEPASSS